MSLIGTQGGIMALTAGGGGYAGKSRLQFEGSNGSTTFTDDNGRIWTPGGAAQISTAQFSGGAASGLFNGANSYIQTPSTADIQFGATTDFTIQFKLRYVSKAGFQTIATRGYTAPGGWLIQTGNGDGLLNFYIWNNSGTFISLASEAAATININQWYSYVITRISNAITITRDAVSTGTGTDASTVFSAGSKLCIGAGNGAGGTQYDPPTAYWFNGYMDDWEIP